MSESKLRRVVVEEIAGDDGPIWTLHIAERRSGRWRNLSAYPEFYNTHYAALTVARDLLSQRNEAEAK